MNQKFQSFVMIRLKVLGQKINISIKHTNGLKGFSPRTCLQQSRHFEKNLEKQGFGHFVTFGPQLAFEVHQQKKP
jgi:glycerol-3-phosphate dehydrogenase